MAKRALFNCYSIILLCVRWITVFSWWYSKEGLQQDVGPFSCRKDQSHADQMLASRLQVLSLRTQFAHLKKDTASGRDSVFMQIQIVWTLVDHGTIFAPWAESAEKYFKSVILMHERNLVWTLVSKISKHCNVSDTNISRTSVHQVKLIRNQY
jgi:hypothetical protein